MTGKTEASPMAGTEKSKRKQPDASAGCKPDRRGESEGKMSLVAHLAEFRKRLLLCACLFLAAGACCLSQSKWFVDQLVQKAAGFTFVYIAPTELLLAYLRLALIGGVVITCPVILNQLWCFIRPGLFEKERKAGFLALTFGVLMFVTGAAFAYELVLPVMLKFFTGLHAAQAISPMVSIECYISFVVTMLVTFGMVFELPVVTVLLTAIGILNPLMLKKNRKYVILVIFIAAALITPPDVTSQLLIALPMLALFEISIFVCCILFCKQLRERDGQAL